MEFRYELTHDDVTAGYTEAVRGSAGLSRAAFWANVAVHVPLGVALAALAQVWFDATEHRFDIELAATAIVMFVALLWTINAAFARRQRTVAQQWVGALPRPVVGRLVDEGLRFESPMGDSLYTWASLIALRRGPQHVFVITVPGLMLAIPLRAFASPEQALEFEREVRGRMKQ